ncbi:MAG TPA: TadE family protein [Sphingomicrobium sp.]|nr:TadE family protein [Sphingomicrobium sp.]
MMGRQTPFSDGSGAAAAEMALVLPLLLTLMMGSVELGSYIYNEHILVKAVRDGARYAARQNFANYSACSGEPGGTVPAETRALVRTSLLAGGSDRFADIEDVDITLAVSCTTTAAPITGPTETMEGIYRGAANGAPIILVSASVSYTPVIGTAFGFSGVGFNIVATEEAAVMGL